MPVIMLLIRNDRTQNGRYDLCDEASVIGIPHCQTSVVSANRVH